ncbi:MAG: RND family transporter [Mycobacterium sp.]|nr:RND family transporter [Mycobacterium sp.]
MIRWLAPVIILAWTALILVLNLALPSLEAVGRERGLTASSQDAPAMQAMTRMGKVFGESDSDSFATVVLEGQEPLDDDVRAYYDGLIRELKNDPQHVQHVQDLWGDRLTAAGAQSPDGKAVYVQLNLAGNQGTALGQDSVAAVRTIVERNPPPAGVKVYVTGIAALSVDLQDSGEKSIAIITAVGGAIIFVSVLLMYRSMTTVVLVLATVGAELAAARGTVAFIGHHGLVELSPFAIALLVALAMAAGTDYGIFFVGRYHEARRAGEDPETAYYTTFRSVAPVVLGSGLTIAGAMLCLSLTRMPIFQSIGVPCAVGLLVAVGVAITLIPAVIAVASRFGLFEPKRTTESRRWRRIGTAVVRWPAPILATTLAIAALGLLALPGYTTSYNDRLYLPPDVPSSLGASAAERHFSQSRMMPDILMIETDRDMRNPADFIVLHKLAKAIFRVPGVARVQGITRPEGTPIEHTSIPFLISLQNAGQQQALRTLRGSVSDLLKQADLMAKQIALTKQTYELQKQLTALTHETVGLTRDSSVLVAELRDHIAVLDDFLRPIRNYLYWEPHCQNIPVCFSIRSVFDAIDRIDAISDKTKEIVANMEKLDFLLPQLLRTFPRTIEILETSRAMLLTTHSTMNGIFSTLDESNTNATAMGQAFDDSKNDDSFYLPPEVFQNPDFQRAMASYLSPDGKAARFIISHKGDPATPEGIARIDPIRIAAEEALKSTPLASAKIYIGGTAATFKDFRDGSDYDLLIAGIGALCLIFIIMLLLIRSLVAALVIVGTVALSLGASFGLSLLLWQHMLGIKLHWIVLPMSVIVLLAVGSDYNLLLVARMKEELAAGINTGIIRAMGGTGKIVTNAGLVFAFTVAAMVFSELRSIGQVGTTIAIGLIFDTLIVRSFMTPSVAALLGRWFWWPQKVRPRPASSMLREYGARPWVRELLEPPEDREPAVDAPVSESTTVG